MQRRVWVALAALSVASGSVWAQAYPQRVIKLQDPTAVCEAIATTVGLMEGAVDASGIHRDLADVGASATVVAAVTSGLGELARSTALARVGSGDLPVKSTPSATVRL